MQTKQKFKVLTYNIQVAMGSKSIHHHVMHSWHHIFPHPQRQENLEQIAKIIQPFDVVALQELDAGSFRTDYINQIDYLADLAKFSYSQQQTTRNLGPFAQHSKALLSRFPIVNYHHYLLPSRLPGRGVTTFTLGSLTQGIFVVNAHLSLGKKAQQIQLEFIADLVTKHQHVIVLGDLNLMPSTLKKSALARHDLHSALDNVPTYPSWKPKKQLDYILVSPSLKILNAGVIPCAYSDHLPVFAELELV
jgi:endonuclease/exonuclease/phosphatase family metal-dependent hydrolase